MDFDSQLNHARKVMEAAAAPAYLRRDSDNATRAAEESWTPTIELPIATAIGRLHTLLDEQAQILDVLVTRLQGVLEEPGPPQGESATDPCPYSTANAVRTIATQAQRVLNHNAVLHDVIRRLAV